MRWNIFLLLIFFPTILFAQANYQAGYVLKNNGDTVKGFINYHEWDVTPKSIDFKVNVHDKKTIEFYPGDVKRFSIPGFENYTVFAGYISMGKTDELNAGTFDTTKKADTIFLKQLVTGKYLTLYYYRDDIKVRYFIAEANGLPVELKYAVYYDEQNQLKKSEIYKGQLQYYLNKYTLGNNKLRNLIEQAKYEQQDLDYIVDNMNNNGAAIKRQPPFRFFAGVALAQTSSTITDGVPNSTAVLPKINFGIDLFNNPNVQQFIFRAELSLTYINPKFVYSQSSLVVEDPGYVEYYSFNQYTATITPQIIFNVYNADKLKVYIDGGLALNFSVYSNNIFTTQSSSKATTTTTAGTFHLQPYWTGIPLQAGVTINKKIEIFASYMPYAYYSKYVFFDFGNRVASLGVKYLFGRKKVYSDY
jgi:hypothetical protein